MAYSFIDTLFANGDDMDPSPFWVLMALCWFVNEKKATGTTGACWPSIKKIAAKAHVSELTARKSIKVLMEKKFITAHQPPGKVRVFYVDFSRIKELAGGKDLEGVKDVSGVKDLEGDPLKMLKGRGERSLPPPLKDLEAEQGNEQVSNRERNRESSMRTSGKTSANAAVASAQAQTPYPEDFDKSLFEEAEREARSFPEPLPEPPALPPIEPPASTPAKPKMAYPPCQYEKVVELYHTNCKGLTRVLVLSDARKRTINARWREFCKEDDLKTVQEALDGFDWYFKEAAKSRFLMGFSNPGPGRDRPFKADFDWLMRPNNFLKVCEGKYANGIQK